MQKSLCNRSFPLFPGEAGGSGVAGWKRGGPGLLYVYIYSYNLFLATTTNPLQYIWMWKREGKGGKSDSRVVVEAFEGCVGVRPP